MEPGMAWKTQLQLQNAAVLTRDKPGESCYIKNPKTANPLGPTLEYNAVILPAGQPPPPAMGEKKITSNYFQQVGETSSL